MDQRLQIHARLMKLAFFVPPPAQRTGGLDAAIDGLRQALNRRGLSVVDDSPTTTAGASRRPFSRPLATSTYPARPRLHRAGDSLCRLAAWHARTLGLAA